MKRPLSSLIPEPEDLIFKLIEVDIQNVQRGENQPRTKFDNDKLSQLSESISKNGILQPLIVQKINQNSFELIAGERRLRAARLAGLKTVPCLIKEVDSKDAAVISLVENVQRIQLNSIDEANGYSKLIEDHNLTPKEVGLLVGKSRSYVSNLLRLSKLSEKVRQSIKDGFVTMGQIKPLINLEKEMQEKVLLEIINLNLSSRDVEEKVRGLSNKDTKESEELFHYKDFLENKTGSKAEIKKTKNKYKVILNFISEDTLKEFIKRIN